MEKSISSKMETEVLAIPFIIKKEQKGYSAECIDLNIVTQGSNLKEARQNIKDAIKLHLKSASKLGILDDELEKIGVVRKNKKLEIMPRHLEKAPIQIPI